MPENGGIGVFAHEYAHNLGADDLYAYGNGETSAGFWALQADDWTGYPIGFEPPAPDPWHLDNWGWLAPKVITDTTQVYTVTIGQASYFNTNTASGPVYRGVEDSAADRRSRRCPCRSGKAATTGGAARPMWLMPHDDGSSPSPLPVGGTNTLTFDTGLWH